MPQSKKDRLAFKLCTLQSVIGSEVRSTKLKERVSAYNNRWQAQITKRVNACSRIPKTTNECLAAKLTPKKVCCEILQP